MQSVAGAGDQLVGVLEHLVPMLRRLDVDGLSIAASAVLRRLTHEGGQRVTDLARDEQASQPGMTQLVGRLERDGLLHRTASPHDGRAVLLEITDAGREVLAERRARYAAVFDELLGRQDPADQEAIAAALPALARLARSTRPAGPAAPEEQR
jgi:DNA-binding MarR family transcriptional regulator